MVHERASWVLKLAGLDEKLADAIVDGLRKLTVEMRTDPAHPLRTRSRRRSPSSPRTSRPSPRRARRSKR